MTLTCTNVTLRQKPLRNDRISLYLDYYPAIRNPYTMKMSRREFLGIYIYAKPKNEQQRMFNQDMLNKAEAIRIMFTTTLRNLSAANVPLAMSPWNCARSSGITCSNANR